MWSLLRGFQEGIDMGWEGGSDTHFLVAIVVCVDAISAGHPMLARLKRGEETGGLMLKSGIKC